MMMSIVSTLPSSNLPALLVCDDDQLIHLTIKHALKGKYLIHSAYHGDEARALLKSNRVAAILLDVQMRTPKEGLELIPTLKELEPDAPIMMISGKTDFETVREAMRLGAVDYIPKDFSPVDLEHGLSRVLERRRLLAQRETLTREVARAQSQHVMIGRSAALAQVRDLIERVRSSQASVVITGETGTGKEVVARQLRGVLPDGTPAPFVAVDSSTIQSTMAESLLFGHEKGAFTGALNATRGIFEEANGGTVYFDEIANMPLEIQAKLLRVLQEREITRLGSTKPIQLSFRVVAATNRDLETMARDGLFKPDLFQRLNVIPITLPSLRERKEDIAELALHFAAKECPGREVTFSEEAITVLQAYDWPGNIRELGNVVAYVMAFAGVEGSRDALEIDVTDLPPKFRDNPKPVAGASATFYERVAQVENQILTEAYSRAQGNVSRLSQELGMDRSHLYSKLKEHGLHQARKK